MFSKTLRMSFHDVVLHKTARKCTYYLSRNAFEWYTVKYPSSHLYFLVLIHTSLKASEYTKKIQVMSGIYHSYTTKKGCITIFCYTAGAFPATARSFIG